MKKLFTLLSCVLIIGCGEKKELKHNAENAMDPEAKAELLAAVKKGDPVVVKQSLAKGADVNARDYDGYTALIKASDWGQIDTVKLLLAKGADVTAKTHYGCTALIAAIQGASCFTERASEFTEVASTLLEKGAERRASEEPGGSRRRQ